MAVRPKLGLGLARGTNGRRLLYRGSVRQRPTAQAKMPRGEGVSKKSVSRPAYGADRGPRWLVIHPVVFGGSVALAALFIVVTAFDVALMQRVFSATQRYLADHAGWFYVLCVNIFLGFAIYLAFSRFGELRLGGRDARAEFSLWGWFAMLFAAGMGIGLVFYSVAEPLSHLSSPPMAINGKIEAAKLAMAITFFHWGLHTWSIYGLVGLALAFFSFNQGLPLTLRSAFYPLFGERVRGLAGDLIDVLAVIATLFGLATSLGLGAQQVATGLARLFAFPHGIGGQVFLIAVITSLATFSVYLGLDRGIRRLSQFTMMAGALLLVFLLAVGPTVFLLDAAVQNVGFYLQRLPELSTWTEAYRGSHWQNSWTIFYWGWWIAWSPFVGMFIARISRGRTIREFLLGVVLVPSLVGFIWLSVFGGAAIYVELFGTGGMADAAAKDITSALFVLLEQYPLATFSSLIAILMVVVFFVTSADSGALVIDIITAGGTTDAPVVQRVFWAMLGGVIAALLLIIGGLEALQTASIVSGLPFALVLLVMCAGLYGGLRQEYNRQRSLHATPMQRP